MSRDREYILDMETNNSAAGDDMSSTTTVTISTTDKLSNRGFHRSGGNSSGAAQWWLRGADFIDIPRTRGDSRLSDITLELEDGSYTLGTGRGRDAIRLTFSVRDGQTSCSRCVQCDVVESLANAAGAAL